jgi:hypothetical protein
MGNAQSNTAAPEVTIANPSPIKKEGGRRASGANISGKKGEQPAKPKAKVLGGITDNQPSNFQWYKPGWEAYLDDSGNVYYFNAVLQETRWDPFSEGATDPADKGGNAAFAMRRQASWSVFDDYAARKEEAEKKKKLIEERAEKVRHDKLAPWKELVVEAHGDQRVMEQHVSSSNDVILQVSQGLYDPQVSLIPHFSACVENEVNKIDSCRLFINYHGPIK